MPPPLIHVVGAGLAGLAAALRITDAGGKAIVHEAAGQAGGRCRSYYDSALAMKIDNGNHLALSGNYATLACLRKIGTADPAMTAANVPMRPRCFSLNGGSGSGVRTSCGISSMQSAEGGDMRRWKAFCAVALAALLVAGCGIVRRQEMQARAQQLKAEAREAAQNCNVAVPAGNPKTAVARAKCQTDAIATLRPIMPYPDLLDLLIASRMAIAERIQSGQLTIVQANEQIAARQFEIIAEEQRRSLANRSVAAQENLATATASAGGPSTCIRSGNVVNCF